MTTERNRRILYVLLALGLASLVGARAWPQAAASPDAQGLVPFVLSVVGTLCFIAAGVMARRLMRGPPK